MNPYADALAAIDAANLSPAVLRLAIRLLAHVHCENGYITISWPDMLTLCSVDTRGSVWKLLGKLKQTGIIHYSTNERVDIAFEAWRTRQNRRVDAPKPTRGRAETDANQENPRAETDAWTRQSERAETDENPTTRRNWRVDASKPTRGRAKNDTPIGLVGRYKTLTQRDDLLLETNQPKPVLTDEQQRSRNLLLDPDIGLSDAVATRLASEHKFDWLLRQVFAWRDDIAAGRVDSPGALVNRIDRNYSPGHLTEKDRASPLYQRHVSEEEQAALVASKYVPSEYADVINS